MISQPPYNLLLFIFVGGEGRAVKAHVGEIQLKIDVQFSQETLKGSKICHP